MMDYIYQAHSHRVLQWNDSILIPGLSDYKNTLQHYTRSPEFAVTIL